MIKLHLDNLHKVATKHGLTKVEIQEQAAKIPEYLEKIAARDQGFYEIVDDEATRQCVEEFAAKVRDKYDHFVVFGIGGSSLGGICLQQAFTNSFAETKLHIIDNIDPLWLHELENHIFLERSLFIVITKSGGTPETMEEYQHFRNKTDAAGLDPKEHFVFVTDPESGKLRQIANDEQIPAFEIPPNVGGRFSVLTPVGLLPASLLAIDTKALLTGAQQMRNAFLSHDFDTNLPFQIATIQYLLGQKGKTINVMMPYAQKLIRFADWYRQLLAESIGKAQNNSGDTVNVGLTPVNALGVTDQHSQSQLYMEGPNDKLLIFIKISARSGILPTFSRLMDAELQATADALTENNRPNFTIEISAVTPETLGALFMLFEAATAFLGEFYDINAFDQPGVERSKVLTKENLQKT